MLHPEPKERITVHIPSSMRKEICEKADAAGQTLSVWVERAMKSYLSSEVEA
jgi:predicted HicB family RNase H-like nuclease